MSSDPTTSSELNMVVNSLPEECREVGRNFFNCLETKYKENNHLNDQQLEESLNNNIIPFCLSQFNLEECLSKDHKI